MLANSAVLQLATGYKLVCRVGFGTIKALGKEHKFDRFWFVAPIITDCTTAPGWTPPTIDLATVERFMPVMQVVTAACRVARNGAPS